MLTVPHKETTTTTVRVPAGGMSLHGDLGMPPHARGVILFAQGRCRA
jgi:hypothetical protein